MPAINVGHISPVGGGEAHSRRSLERHNPNPTKINPYPAITKKQTDRHAKTEKRLGSVEFFVVVVCLVGFFEPIHSSEVKQPYLLR